MEVVNGGGGDGSLLPAVAVVVNGSNGCFRQWLRQGRMRARVDKGARVRASSWHDVVRGNGKGKGNGNGEGDSNSKRDGKGDGKGNGNGDGIQAAEAVKHCCCCCWYSAAAALLLSCRSPILPVLLLCVCQSSGRMGVGGMRERQSSGSGAQHIYSSVQYTVNRKCW